jgi:hypothetical protein
MTIRIPRSLRDELKALADKDERSLATTIRRALRRAVQADKPVMRGEHGPEITTPRASSAATGRNVTPRFKKDSK